MASKRTKRLRAEGRDANKRVLMTGVGPNDAMPTDAPCDRAHDQRDEQGFLRSARSLPDGLTEARRYPSCQMIRQIRQWLDSDGRGGLTMRRAVLGYVSFEKEIEDTAERERRLEEMGLLTPCASMAEEMRRAMGFRDAKRDLAYRKSVQIEKREKGL